MSEKPYREAYLEPALEEAIEIEFYLESQQKGLGDAFRKEFDATVETLLDFPEIAPIVIKGKKIRRMLMRHFSYAIIYKLTDDRLLLIGAVEHTSRKPGYWQDRF